MGVEIEHKYTVKSEAWNESFASESTLIRQGYMQTDPNKTIRVRTKGSKGYLTIKGKAIGATRLEFEYEIPVDDANVLLDKFCKDLIDKTRYIVLHDGKTWEVDVFSGTNQGLIFSKW